MGALHAGHLALVRLARRRADRVIVSIFVNPTQFAPNEDFGSYPRTWDADLAALSRTEGRLVWAPAVATMYPHGFATRIAPGGPAAAGLEDAFRPHFFGGVAPWSPSCCCRSRPISRCSAKRIISSSRSSRAMARDLDIPARIVGVPTVREKDGLAMSSRNAYLSPSERAVAPTLYRVLKDCAARIKAGAADRRRLSPRAARTIERAGFVVDYLEARHAETLAPIAIADGRPDPAPGRGQARPHPADRQYRV